MQPCSGGGRAVGPNLPSPLFSYLIFSLLAVFLRAGCWATTPTPSPTPTRTHSSTLTPTPSRSSSPTPSRTRTQTHSPTTTLTGTPSFDGVNVSTPTPIPTHTPTARVTFMKTGTATSTPTRTIGAIFILSSGKTIQIIYNTNANSSAPIHLSRLTQIISRQVGTDEDRVLISELSYWGDRATLEFAFLNTPQSTTPAKDLTSCLMHYFKPKVYPITWPCPAAARPPPPTNPTTPPIAQPKPSATPTPTQTATHTHTPPLPAPRPSATPTPTPTTDPSQPEPPPSVPQPLDELDTISARVLDSRAPIPVAPVPVPVVDRSGDESSGLDELISFIIMGSLGLLLLLCCSAVFFLYSRVKELTAPSLGAAEAYQSKEIPVVEGLHLGSGQVGLGGSEREMLPVPTGV